ncbi:MAG: helix-turn-helix domain-containing protein [Firmicutes bacterium]|nr:helix-turn-helix domain-containing protein [Bacillota bacterium]
MNTFAKNLELLMKENAVSQKQLAQIINVRQQTVSRYVKGAREPDIDILIEIAKFFNVTVGQLVGSEEGI